MFPSNWNYSKNRIEKMRKKIGIRFRHSDFFIRQNNPQPTAFQYNKYRYVVFDIAMNGF